MAKKYFHGFTLVELMIVLAIISILATIAIMYFGPQIFKGNDAERKADIDRIKIALEEYEKDNNCYPPRDKMLSCGTDASIAIHPYLNNVPCDPVKHIAYYYESSNSDDSLCGAWFRLYTVLENKSDTSATPNIGPSGSYNYVQSSGNAPD
jgi:prepilin-type N-terminal cleavage/methylation domain-containing protein